MFSFSVLIISSENSFLLKTSILSFNALSVFVKIWSNKFGLRKLFSSGINDVGGILMDETITRSAGANHGQELDLGKIQLLTEELNLKLVRRNTNYETISSSTRSNLINQNEIPMKSINDFHNEARI